MKKTRCLMAAFAAILLLFSGCAGKAGTVSTDGSTSMQKVIGALSEATVKSGEYALQRPFVLVTRTNETLSDSAQKFFDYMTSSDASDIIAAAGAVSAN